MITLEPTSSSNIAIRTEEHERLSLSPSILHPTEKKIWGFRELEKGWHFGDGETIQKETAFEAIKLHSIARHSGLNESDAFPGLSGEVRVTFYHGNSYLEFTIETDKTWTVLHEKDDLEVLYQEGLTFKGATEILRDFVCNISEYFRSNITGMTITSGSPVWLLGHLPKTAPYPLFKKTVQWKPPEPFAHTSPVIMAA